MSYQKILKETVVTMCEVLTEAEEEQENIFRQDNRFPGGDTASSVGSTSL
jgi:hypothetical protein